MTRPYYECAEIDYGPILPPPPATLARMVEEGWTLIEREASIWSVLSSQALSGIYCPLVVAYQAFDAAFFRPLPSIGEDDV